MPGPLPKDESERRRRNAPTIPTTNLPVSGYRGPIPEPTVALSETARKFYDRAWRTPSAAAWHEEDADVVAEWAGLKALVASKLAAGEEPSSSLLGQIQSREDRLLLSTLARLKARARIVDDPPDEDEVESESGSAWKPEDFAG